ncbi:MAG: hypothetical protein HKN58_04705 [Xanthomonadales bacterium]|nr:hypothetical protein [Xanthomonadales bacterium]
MNAASSAAQRFTLLVCFFIASPAALAEEFVVNVFNNFFDDNDITIQVGDSVRFVNSTGVFHNVTAAGFENQPSASSFNHVVTFNTPGVYNYSCTLHSNMDGTITVEGQAQSTELAATAFEVEPGSYASGNPFEAMTTITNSGNADSGAFTVDYYAMSQEMAAVLQSTQSAGGGKSASGLQSIPEGAILLDSSNVSNVPMGDSVNHQAMVDVPESVIAGDYVIGVTLNFADGNANDNDRTAATVLTLLGKFLINAGLNDAWVNADAPFQGLFFTIFPDLSLFFAAWFTFDSVPPGQDVTAVFAAPDLRWVTASGIYSEDSVTLTAELTTGGVFNDSEPEATQTPNYGTITIQFLSCNEALVSYDFPSVGLSGQMTLTRVVGDNIPLCRALLAELQMAP